MNRKYNFDNYTDERTVSLMLLAQLNQPTDSEIGFRVNLQYLRVKITWS